MTSTQQDIDLSYSVSNEFFELWLDKNMHYTSASFLRGDETLEEAQENKVRILADWAEVTPDSLVLDIGCGWGSCLEYLVNRRGVKEAHGITLSTAQLDWIHQRQLPGAKAWLQDYATYEPERKYDALISIEMIDHLCSPRQAREGQAVAIYRSYFNKLASWVNPGACFGFQAILSDRVPRTRKDVEDLAFTANVIFPGDLPRRPQPPTGGARPGRPPPLGDPRAAHAAPRLRPHHRRVAPPHAPPRGPHPQDLGRRPLRRLRALPGHLRPRLLRPAPVDRRRPDEARPRLTAPSRAARALSAPGSPRPRPGTGTADRCP